LTSAQIRFTSTTGRTLVGELFVTRTQYGSDYQTSLQVSIGDRAGEFHTWALDVSNSTFTFRASTGRGSVRTKAAQVDPFGTVSLTIKPRGKPLVHDCAAGNSWTRQTVTITGTFLFNTQSTKWGSVGSRHHMTTFKGKSRVETDYGDIDANCFNNSVHPCAGGVSWQSPNGQNGGFSESYMRLRNKWRSNILFFNDESLSKPVNAERFDDVAIVSKPPVLVSRPNGAKVVRVHAPGKGLITGSARLVSVAPAQTTTLDCSGGSTRTWKASYTNGTKPLTVHLDIGGAVTVRNHAAGASIGHDSG
jgi:hypothetical protein